MKKIFAFGLAVTVFLAGCVKESRTPVAVDNAAPNLAEQMFAPQTDQKFVPNELLIKFKNSLPKNGRIDVLARINGSIDEQVVTDAMRASGDNDGFYIVKTTMDVMAAVKSMRSNSGIEYAEPNWIYTYATSNDPYFTSGQLWGMYGPSTSPANAFGSNAAAAWAAGKTGSAGVYVGVIDEGIQFNHPDLDGRIWTNPHDPNDKRDNDGNGYKNDIRGWDFANNDNTIYDGGSTGNQDDHGTHVAGTIGAKNNGTGVVGVNWDVRLISGKFLGFFGGTTANAVRAVDYFTDLKKRHGLKIVATNNSWGGGGYSQTLHDAIIRAAKADILFIAAAGNNSSNNDATANYPSNYNTSVGTSTETAAAYDAVIAVASITSTGDLSSFSNYGATQVDIGAPGSGIISTTAFNSYSNYSGTSMATPHVTGAVALYAAAKSGATGATIRNAILSSAVETPSLKGKCTTSGRLDVNAALSK